jgi:hypothetical protein
MIWGKVFSGIGASRCGHEVGMLDGGVDSRHECHNGVRMVADGVVGTVLDRGSLSKEMGREWPIRQRWAVHGEKQGRPQGEGKRDRKWVGKGKWEQEGWASYRESAQRHCRAIKYFFISKSFIDRKLFHIRIKFQIQTTLIIHINLIAHNQYRTKLCNNLRCNKQIS